MATLRKPGVMGIGCSEVDLGGDVPAQLATLADKHGATEYERMMAGKAAALIAEVDAARRK
jgi:hypothetical protein